MGILPICPRFPFEFAESTVPLTGARLVRAWRMAVSRYSRPFEVPREEYPFKDHWLDLPGGGVLHYVDEGKGVPVVMLHGNPTWSFLYRKVIKELGSSARSLAPDLPGFGFSRPPAAYGYMPQEHAAVVAAWLDGLKLKEFVLVVQDWGGPIGMSYAVNNPERIAGLVILNTWAWEPWLGGRFFSAAMSGMIGRHYILKKNFFAKKIVPTGIVKEEHKSETVLNAYTDQFPDPDARVPTLIFPWAIRNCGPWLKSLDAGLARLAGKPVELVWAMKDPAFGKEMYIDRWLQAFPDAGVTRLPEASHYLQEDEPEVIAEAIRRVLPVAKRSARGSQSAKKSTKKVAGKQARAKKKA